MDNENDQGGLLGGAFLNRRNDIEMVDILHTAQSVSYGEFGEKETSHNQPFNNNGESRQGNKFLPTYEQGCGDQNHPGLVNSLQHHLKESPDYTKVPNDFLVSLRGIGWVPEGENESYIQHWKTGNEMKPSKCSFVDETGLSYVSLEDTDDTTDLFEDELKSQDEPEPYEIEQLVGDASREDSSTDTGTTCVSFCRYEATESAQTDSDRPKSEDVSITMDQNELSADTVELLQSVRLEFDQVKNSNVAVKNRAGLFGLLTKLLGGRQRVKSQDSVQPKTQVRDYFGPTISRIRNLLRPIRNLFKSSS